MERIGQLLVGAFVCLGCQQVLGIEEGRSSADGGGGTMNPVTAPGAGGMNAGSGAGGVGGVGGVGDAGGAGGADTTSAGGGGGTSDVLPDWAPFLTATYRFEPGAALGADWGGLYELTNDGAVPVSGSQVEGDAFAQVIAGMAGFQYTGQVPFGTSTSLTIGGWFSVDAGTPETVASRADTTSGYRVIFDPSNETAVCRVRNNTFNADVEAHGWHPGTWAHVTCIFEPTRITTLTEVETATTVVASWPHADTAAFRLGFVDGGVDEVFFHDAALSDPTIRRIRQCRIDGSACRCDPQDRSVYLTCGGTCAGLPPCDQAEPD